MLATFIIIILILLGCAMALLLWQLRGKNALIRKQTLEIESKMEEVQDQNTLLEASNSEKQQIISVVSHDLKGPFNRIFALVHLFSFSPGNLTAEQKEYLGKINNIALDGLSMVYNLLDSRKVDEKELEMSEEEVDLIAVMQPLVDQYKNAGEKKEIRVALEAPAKLGMITDKSFVTRIADNLLSNALKFSPRGTEVKMIIRDGPAEVKLVVADQGPGLSVEDRKKLYRKFVKLTPQPTGGESSTGLGLALVRALLQRLGGQIQCESELGKGSVFTVVLPKGRNF